MKKLTIASLLVIVVLGCVNEATAQTRVSGTLTSDTEWRVEGSPYEISDSLKVPEGIRLVIDPGVTIIGVSYFDVEKYDYVSRTSIIVEGSIQINGTSQDIVDVRGNKIIFRETDLGNSQVSFAQFQLAGSIEIQNNPAVNIKNTGELKVLNSEFITSSGAFAYGDSSTAVLTIKNCSFQSTSKVKSSRFPGTTSQTVKSKPPLIYVSNCSFNNASVMGYDGYGYESATGYDYITIDSATIENDSKLNFVKVYASTITSSTFEGSLIMERCDVRNAQIKISQGPLSISDSRILTVRGRPTNTLYTSGHNNVTITNTVFTGVNVSDALAVSGDKTRIEKCTFSGYDRPIHTVNIGADFYFKNNNFDNSWLYAFFNWGPCIDASNNYWGTSDTLVVRSKIVGCVEIKDPLSSPSINFELPAPKDPYLVNVSGPVRVGWTKNESPRTAGYKLYLYKNFTVELLGDAGSNNYFISDQITDQDIVFITAYDSEAKNSFGFSNGHEGPFSSPATKLLSEVDISLHATTSCIDTIRAVISSKPDLEDNYYILQISDINRSFENAINLDSIHDGSILSSKLPESIQFGVPYKLRIRSTRFNAASEPIEVIPHNTYSADFSTDLDALCGGGIAKITYTGNAPKSANYKWDFDGGSVSSGNDSGPYSVYWGKGDRTISLTVEDEYCKSPVTSKTLTDIKPIMAVKIDDVVCINESFQVEYTGSNYTNASMNFYPGITVISGSGAGPYTLKLNPAIGGPYRINVSALNNYPSGLYACSADTSFEVRNIIRSLPKAQLYKVTIDESTSRAVLTWLSAPDWAWILKIVLYEKESVSMTDSAIDYFNAIHVYNGSYPMWRYETKNVYKEGVRYNVAWQNLCETSELSDNFHKPIFLTVTSDGNNFRLDWTKYEGNFNYNSHRILRSIDGSDFQMISEVSPETVSFTDVIDESITTISYQIEILNTNVPFEYLNDGVFNSSRSNIVRTTVEVMPIDTVGQVDSVLWADFNRDLMIFPNPTSDLVTISLKTGSGSTYQLIDLSGKVIESGKFDKEKMLDLIDLSPGTYVLSVETPVGPVIRKIQKF